MINKEIFLYVVLVGVIGFFTFLLATTKFDPAETSAKKIIEQVNLESSPAANKADELKAPVYKNLGTKDIFKTIIPKPTPPPTPVVTPKPPPPLQRIIGTWQILMILDTEVTFQNNANNENWNMKVGEIKQVTYMNEPCDIKLLSIDMNTFKVKVGFGEQQTELEMKF